MRRLLKGAVLWDAFRYLVAVLFALLLLVRLVWAISGSFHANAALFNDPYQWLPRVATSENYITGWGEISFGRDMLNSLVIAFVLPTIGVFLGLMAGYALGSRSSLAGTSSSGRS